MSVLVYKKCGAEISIYDGLDTKTMVDEYCGPTCPLLEKPFEADAQLCNNPKDKFGSKKVSVTKLPAVGIMHGSMGMMYGASQYDPYNWRDNAVIASIYVDAMIRHLLAWFDQKEEIAEDSGVTHLGHIIANASIILDAQATGNLIDDRPKNGKASVELTRLNALIPDLQKRWSEIKEKRLKEKEKANG